MGVDFFREVTRLQELHGQAGSVVANGLQTNGLLLDDEFARHLAAYNFLVGVSLDGPAEQHDRFRTHASGRGSHTRVLEGIAALRRHDVEFNILTLVSSANAAVPLQVYDYLCDEGVAYHQYIPCVEFDEVGVPLPWTITGEQWGEFLCVLFDRWWERDQRRVSVRLFDALLEKLIAGTGGLCHMQENCCHYLVVEHNGDVYPCDFFVESERRLGNIATDTWEALRASPAYRSFGKMKSQWSQACAACPYVELCAGDCLKHRFVGHVDPRQLSWLCGGWQQFYAHALPRLRALARELGREQATTSGAPAAEALADQAGEEPVAPVSRNAPCPCGSGKKYKRCCGR
jgi:uncharacterized protein